MRPTWDKTPRDRDDDAEPRSRPTGEYRPLARKTREPRETREPRVSMTTKIREMVRAAVAEALRPHEEKLDRLEEKVDKLEGTSDANNRILLEQEARAKLLREQKEEAEKAEKKDLELDAAVQARKLEHFKVRLTVFGAILVALITLIGAAIGSHSSGH